MAAAAAQTEDLGRWLLADSSPQQGCNYYARIDDRLPWPIGAEARGLVRLDLPSALMTQNLPLCTLEYGPASLEYKLAASVHIRCLDNGSVRVFHKSEHEVYSLTSNMGVDMYVAEGPSMLLQDLPTFEKLVSRIDARQSDCADPNGADGFVFPETTSVGDFLHQVFGCREEAL